MDYDLIYTLYNKSRDNDKYKKYLASRKLEDFRDVGYISTFLFKDTVITDSIMLYVRNARNEITKIMTRKISESKYDVVYKSEDDISCYNIMDTVGNNLPIVLTESVFDCESIKQNLDFLVPVSFTTIALTSKERIFFNVMFYKRRLFVCYDNDYSGLKRMKNFIKDCNEHDNKVSVLDTPYKDINEFLINSNKEKFVEHMRSRVL